MKTRPSSPAILATQKIRTLLDGPDDPKTAVKMAEIIDGQMARVEARAKFFETLTQSQGRELKRAQETIDTCRLAMIGKVSSKHPVWKQLYHAQTSSSPNEPR